MKAVFADTFFYLALLNRDDAAHDDAVQLARQFTGRVVTTAWVLTEVADAFASPSDRRAFLWLHGQLSLDPLVTIVPASDELFQAGIELYGRRLDKEWSLTDCISFVVMSREGIAQALTADRHFEQAGFLPLFSRS
jgi:predicted nucleic acid-binding protein